MFDYLRKHWRGGHSLARSYWLNGALVTLLSAALVVLLSRFLADLPVSVSALLWLLLLTLLALVTVWQLVGIWRSARRTVRTTGRWFWPRVAQLLVLVGFASGVFNVVTAGSDLARLLSAMHQPMLTDYRVDHPELSELTLVGAINEESVNEVIGALMDPSIDLFRITSHGGLLEPALKLAQYVATNQVVVLAHDQCLSACVLVLAASPYAALDPGTRVILHRTQPLLELSNPDFREENERYLQQTMDYYRAFGLPEWAIIRMEEEGTWAPSLEEQIRMGLLKYIHNPVTRNFEPAPVYCAVHPSECAATGEARLPTEGSEQ